MNGKSWGIKKFDVYFSTSNGLPEIYKLTMVPGRMAKWFTRKVFSGTSSEKSQGNIVPRHIQELAS